ncbi:DUF2470 domain-containing protein [Microbacterium sp.]|uniref:DUF2470 domain-containing protein n=1 Tax=Microbacterium sp. TaxID=51671 RepID=UPI002811BDB0|nr:DUF2470 domain-containing protein [Microbacterium sp.]
MFDSDVVSAVLRHMNGDHADDNLLIARAFADRAGGEVSGAEMARFDGDGGTWQVTRSNGDTAEVTIAWPGGAISDRPSVRREVVAVYEAACARLGVKPQPHG